MTNGGTGAKFILALALIVTSMSGCSNRLPADRDLITGFFKHEAKFNKLVSMAEKDSQLTWIASGSVETENLTSPPSPETELGISRQRWDEYRALFKELGLKKGLGRTQDLPGTILLITEATGLAIGGTEKGYAYRKDEPARLYASLDKHPRDAASLEFVFKRIKPHWYVYRMWDD